MLLAGVFISNIPGLIDKINNADIYAEIAKTTDVTKKAFLEKKILYVNLARILLLAVFAGVSYLVYVAYEKRKREGRIS